MVIDFILSDYSTAKRAFDPGRLADDPRGISGTEVQVFGNAAVLARRGHRVRIFSRWTEEREDGSLSFVDLDRRLGTSDVALAYHDGRPLNGWDTRYKMVMHQTFEVLGGVLASNADLYLSATEHNMRFHEPSGGSWEVLPNACDFGDLRPWRPEKGRMIFHTDPPRGLHVLLRAMPEIRRRVPEAHLHVYGRAMEYDSLMRSLSGPHAGVYREIVESLSMCKDCVTVHGGSHSRNGMLEAVSRAAVFAYPSEPPVPCEVFPISVMECCAAGVPVVLSPADGIERIYGGVVDLVPSPPSENLGAFVEATVRALTDEAYAGSLSDRETLWAAERTFESTATQLEELIGRHSGCPVRVSGGEPVRPYISVIVPTFRPGGLDVLFTGLRDQSFRDFEVVVVDMILRHRRWALPGHLHAYPGVRSRFVEPIDNIFPFESFAHCFNTGLVHARGDIAYVMCDYTYLPPDCLQRHADFHRSNPGCGYTAPIAYLKVPPLKPLPRWGRPGYEVFDTPACGAVPYTYPDDLAAGRYNGALWSIFADHVEADPRLTCPAIDYEHSDGKLKLQAGWTDWKWVHLKNDSFPLEAALAVNGCDEDFNGARGYQDPEFAERLMLHAGVRWWCDPANVTHSFIVKEDELPRLRRTRSICGNRQLIALKRLANYGKSFPSDLALAEQYGGRPCNDWGLREYRSALAAR